MKIEVLNPALLKTLYYLLIELSSHPQCTAKKGAALIDLDIKHSFCGIRVKFKDVRMLSDVLFRALPESFSQLLSTLHDLFRKSDSGEAGMHLDMWAMIEKMNLLLRCCMLALNMVDCQEYLLEKGRILIAILRKLNSLNLVGSGEESVICFEKSVSREHIYGNDWIATYTEDFVASLHFIQPFDPYLPFLSSVLEVFADELLVHRQIREYFKLIDSVSSGSEKPFICYAGYDNIGIVIEVISSHFVISYSDGQAYERLLNRLLFVDGKEFRAPELSPPAAASLFLNPVMLSAPKFYQAHLILLVSEATCTCMGLEISKPDPRLLDCYLSLLESSIILYGNHMSTCQLDYISTDSGISFVKSHISGGHLPSSFESCVQPVTRKNIDRLISNFDNSWHLHLRSMFSKMEPHLVASSIAYMKDCEYLLDVSCRDDILSILNCIIFRASGDVKSCMLHNFESTSAQDIIFLASVLKLMSSSLLEAVRCLRHGNDMGSLRTLKNFSTCKEYNSIMGIIDIFREFKICLPIQKSTFDMMETQPTRQRKSELMLFHLSGLLSLSFASGLDFLVRVCILAIIAVLNLLIFEEGNLDALISMIDSRVDSNIFESPLKHVKQASRFQKSSLTVASKFQKIQTLHLSTDSLGNNCTEPRDGQEILLDDSVPNDMDHVVGLQGKTEDTCHRKILLECLLQKGEKLSDFDDVADFIACDGRKDYRSWFKDRQRYRRWKCEKMALLRWRRQRTCRYMKRKYT